MANYQKTELTNEFVSKIRAAAGDNITSVILYGSAAEGEFHPEYSDLNLLCMLRDSSFALLAKIAGVAEWWRGKKHHPPLILTSEELRASAAVFSIEFIDMKQRYRVLYGEDVLQSLRVPMAFHLFQLRYELREKLGEQGRKHSREAVTELSTRLNFDASPFVQLMDLRAQKFDRKQLPVAGMVERYLSAIETVAASVDTMQGSRQSI